MLSLSKLEFSFPLHFIDFIRIVALQSSLYPNECILFQIYLSNEINVIKKFLPTLKILLTNIFIYL